MPTTSTPNPRRRRRVGRLVAAGVAAGLLLVVGASPAGADTSQASATGLLIAGGSLGGTAAASNDGTQGTVTAGSGSPALLPSNPVVTAGAIGQLARANADGTSAACAGLVAPAAVVTIAPGGSCNPGTATTGISLNLGTDNLQILRLTAGAITAECSASSTGAPTGRARLANATATLGGIIPVATLNADPAVNQGLDLGIVSVLLNRQVTNPDGSLTVTALSVTVAGQGLVEVGKVTCGPNEVTGAIPLVPAAGLPLAAGVVLLAGGAILVLNRRRTQPAGLPV